MHDPHPLPGSSVVVDGLRVHTVQHGSGTGLPIVLLHGLPTTSYLWHDVVRDLATRPGPGRRCVAPDLPGLGASEVPPASRAGIAEIAQTVIGLLNRLEIEQAVLVGHDLGGGVAVSVTALAPARVAGLVLVDAPVHTDTWPPRPALPLLAPAVGEAYLAGLRLAPDLARGVLARALGNAVPPAELEPYLRPLLRPDGARGLLRFVRAVDLDAVQGAWRIVCAAAPPALVLWGERDGVHALSYGRRVADELPGAAWVPVSDAGHLLPQERPERVAEEVAAFVAELESVAAAMPG